MGWRSRTETATRNRMRLDVLFTAGAAHAAEVEGRTAVVVDVLRATSTVVEALANGARAIYPTASIDEALKLAVSLGREDTLLCGERRGLPVEGFDLGNSPREFTAERVADNRLVMSTTNGTRAFVAAGGADRVVALSLLNLSVVTRAVMEDERVVVVCAGREGRFSLEDAVAAGGLIGRIEELRGEELELGDAARAARTLALSVSPDASFLKGTEAGRALVEIGQEADLELCAEIDRHAAVPEMLDGMLRLSPLSPG